MAQKNVVLLISECILRHHNLRYPIEIGIAQFLISTTIIKHTIEVKDKEILMRRLIRSKPVILLLLAIFIIGSILLLRRPSVEPEILPIGDLVEQVEAEDAIRFIVQEDEVEVIYPDGSSAFTHLGPNKTLADLLYEYGQKDNAPAAILVEVIRSSIFDQGLFVAILVSIVGLLIGALLLKQYFGRNTHNPA